MLRLRLLPLLLLFGQEQAEQAESQSSLSEGTEKTEELQSRVATLEKEISFLNRISELEAQMQALRKQLADCERSRDTSPKAANTQTSSEYTMFSVAAALTNDLASALLPMVLGILAYVSATTGFARDEKLKKARHSCSSTDGEPFAAHALSSSATKKVQPKAIQGDSPSTAKSPTARQDDGGMEAIGTLPDPDPPDPCDHDVPDVPCQNVSKEEEVLAASLQPVAAELPQEQAEDVRCYLSLSEAPPGLPPPFRPPPGLTRVEPLPVFQLDLNRADPYLPEEGQWAGLNMVRDPVTGSSLQMQSLQSLGGDEKDIAEQAFTSTSHEEPEQPQIPTNAWPEAEEDDGEDGEEEDEEEEEETEERSEPEDATKLAEQVEENDLNQLADHKNHNSSGTNGNVSHKRPKKKHGSGAEACKERGRRAKQKRPERDAADPKPKAKKRSASPDQPYLEQRQCRSSIVLLALAVAVMAGIGYKVIGVLPARHSNLSSFMEESLPEHCTNEIPGHVVVMGPEYKLPKKIVETKPSISLHAPCFLKSFQKVSKKYRPTGNWHWYKTGQASGEQLSIQHSHEPPIFSARARDDSAVVTFLTDNIFPKFGELNDMSYEWYVLQQDAGFVAMLPDPAAHESLQEAQRHWRPLFQKLAHTFYPRYFMAYASTFDEKSLEWIRKDFGVTSFPAVVVYTGHPQDQLQIVQQDVREMTYDNLAQFIQDVEDGCMTWLHPILTFYDLKPITEKEMPTCQMRA
eukprot:s3346_g3.t1